MEGRSGQIGGMGARLARGSSRGSDTAMAAVAGSPAEQEGMQGVLQLQAQEGMEGK